MKKNVQVIKIGDVILIPLVVTNAQSALGGETMKISGYLAGTQPSEYTQLYFQKDSKVQLVKK